jgi:hypothetical protein
MNPNSQQPIELTMIFVPDQKTGQTTAFFAQFPEALAIGKDEDDAQIRLMNIFTLMMNDRKEEVMKQHLQGAEYKSKQANLVFE